MKRVTNWRAKLTEALAVDPGKSFAWGGHDCFLGLVVPAVQAMTGEDLGADLRGKYDTADGAKAALVAAGFADLGAAVASKFNEIPVAQAHIGDIVTLESGGEGLGVGLGIVLGERVMVLSPQGQATVRLARATRAFRVG